MVYNYVPVEAPLLDVSQNYSLLVLLKHLRLQTKINLGWDRTILCNGYYIPRLLANDDPFYSLVFLCPLRLFKMALPNTLAPTQILNSTRTLFLLLLLLCPHRHRLEPPQ